MVVSVTEPTQRDLRATYDTNVKRTSNGEVFAIKAAMRHSRIGTSELTIRPQHEDLERVAKALHKQDSVLGTENGDKDPEPK